MLICFYSVKAEMSDRRGMSRVDNYECKGKRYIKILLHHSLKLIK